MSLQKAIVYELFAIFLAIVIVAISLAETIAYGYLTGPWIFLAVPGLIALVGFVQALGASDSSSDGGAGPDVHDPSSPRSPQVDDDSSDEETNEPTSASAPGIDVNPPY